MRCKLVYKKVADGLTWIIEKGKSALNNFKEAITPGGAESTNNTNSTKSDKMLTVLATGDRESRGSMQPQDAEGSTAIVEDGEMMIPSGGNFSKATQNAGRAANILDKGGKAINMIYSAVNNGSGNTVNGPRPPMSINDTVRLANPDVLPQDLDTTKLSSNGKVFIIKKRQQ